MATRDEAAHPSREVGLRRVGRVTTGAVAVSAAAIVGFGVLARDHTAAAAGTGSSDDQTTTTGTTGSGTSQSSGSGSGLVSSGDSSATSHAQTSGS
jgi:hypothetical protein